MESTLIWLIGGLVVLMLLGAFLVKISRFREELAYINIELSRSVNSRGYWKKQKFKLWMWFLFSIPYRA